MSKRCDSKGTNGNELVQCAGDHLHDGLHHQWSDDSRLRRSTTELWWNGAGARCFVNVCPTDTIAVRRASAEAMIAAQNKYYGTEPKPLPATLPAGTITSYGPRAVSALRLTDSGMYGGTFDNYPHEQVYMPCAIAWKTVLVQESAAMPKYGTQPAVLPERLPVGTRTKNGVSVAKSTLTLRVACDGIAAAYIGKWQADAMGPNAYQGAAWADTIGWNTVLVQEAKPVVAETDEAWCARQLAEYTGKPARCAGISGFGIDVRLIADSANLVFRVPHIHVRARDAEWFRAELAKYEAWPRAGTCQLENWLTVGSRRPARCAMAAGHDGRHADGKGSVWAECPAGVRPLSEQTGEELRATARLVGLRPDPYREHALLHNIDERVVGELTRAKPGQEAAAIRSFVAWSNERRKPKATASSRELAEGHPVGWPSLEGSDEP